MTSRNLILSGFMGVGKSTVGRICAQQLGYTFIDTDIEIERREGVSIPRLFEQKGEAYFRARETELVEEIATCERLVVATGGGMIVNDASRAVLLGAGVCVALVASVEELLKRLGPEAAARRPMLQGSNPEARVAQLLKERAPKYAQLHYHISTSGLHSPQVAERVVSVFRQELERIAVKTPDSSKYDIVVGHGLLDQIGLMLAGRGYASVAVVADENTGRLFGERVTKALAQVGLPSFVHLMPAGEHAKHLQTVEAIYKALAEHGAERNSAVLALGGGVVGDVAGFAAATYLRGLPFVQAPTSLLAMADSSIGGKVGVDTSFGKNLVGAFKQPELVVIDLDCLQTLPDVELRCGLAEIIKAGLIKGGEFYEALTQDAGRITRHSPLATRHLINAIHLKREVVEEDPYEKGRRALLNLGHTFGHGIEAWSQFEIKHGEAVSLGMVCALRASRWLGLCDGALVDETLDVLHCVGLPTHLSAFPTLPAFEVDAVWRMMQSDKKKAGGTLRFILIREPGDCFISHEVTEQLAKEMLRTLDRKSNSVT
jgi:3-dehydroquinate synthase